MVERGMWRDRADQKLRVQYKDLDTVADIIKKILQWLGNVVRMDHARIVKKIFESKPEGRKEWEDLD
jgi:hypothetical protein